MFGAASRGGSSERKNTVAKVTNTEEKEENFETYGLEPCPLYKALWKNDDEDRDGVYYKLRNSACYSMENTKVDDWKEDSKDDKGNKIVKAPWMENSAVVLSCESGFLKTVKDKKVVCVDESSFCPLNGKAVLEKKGKQYFDALNSEEGQEKECNLPVGSKAVKMTKDQLENAGFEQNFKGFYLYCKSGYYSEENGIQCKKCPDFYTSDIGENIGANSCKPTKDCEKEVGKGYVQSTENGESVKSPWLLGEEAITKCVVEQKQGYDKETGKCKPCDDGFEPDSKGVCQITQNEKTKRAIKNCWDKTPKEGYDGKDCIKCNEGFEPNDLTGICEETEEHKQKGCFDKKQLYSHVNGCYDCPKGKEFEDGKCVDDKETKREKAIALCTRQGKPYAWDKDDLSKCGEGCDEGKEVKDGRCVETFESKRKNAIKSCENNRLPYAWDRSDVTRCGAPCSSGYEIMPNSGRCIKSEETRKMEELQRNFNNTKKYKNDSSKWSLFLDISNTMKNKALKDGIYKVEVAGGAGGRGGDATVRRHWNCEKTYSGGAGGKGEIVSKMILVDKPTSFDVKIGEKGGNGGDKNVWNDEIWADSGADGKETVLEIKNIETIKANPGKKGTGAWNDDYYCGRYGNSSCSCGGGSAGFGYSNGNDGKGYVKIYEYKG